MLSTLNDDLLSQWKDSFNYEGFSALDLLEVKKVLLKEKNFSMLLEKYGKDILDDIEKSNISLIKSQSVAKRRGDLFEDFVYKNCLKLAEEKDIEIHTQIDEKSDLFPSFLKKKIAIDKIDLLIKSKSYNAVCFIQASLWGGGQQLNRGEKYNSSEPFHAYSVKLEPHCAE